MGKYGPRKYNEGDRVEIIDENDTEILGAHGFPMGTIIVLPDPAENFDDYDNSWLIRQAMPTGERKMWVMESALGWPITPQDEDEAIASIMRAAQGGSNDGP